MSSSLRLVRQSETTVFNQPKGRETAKRGSYIATGMANQQCIVPRQFFLQRGTFRPAARFLVLARTQENFSDRADDQWGSPMPASACIELNRNGSPMLDARIAIRSSVQIFLGPMVMLVMLVSKQIAETRQMNHLRPCQYERSAVFGDTSVAGQKYEP